MREGFRGKCIVFVCRGTALAVGVKKRYKSCRSWQKDGVMPRKTQLNVHEYSKDWRARVLATCGNASFMMEDVYFFSIEGFIQGIKYRPFTKRREHAFRSLQVTAQAIGKNSQRKRIWWKGKEIAYGSKKHKEYIERAFRARILKDQRAQVALAACANVNFVYRPKRDEPRMSLRSAHVSAIFTKLRDELIKTGTLKPR